jgi:Fic family protein
MAIQNLLLRIDELQSKINSFGKFDEEILKKINYKFRLDWNYYSNAMEGNSLTKAETRSVMVDAILLEGKSFKDVQEMRGHDDVVLEILKIGKGELRLSEKRIKTIHKGIIFENRDEFVNQVGEWKSSNNHLINYRGEKFDFTDYSDVKDEMHQLLDWLNAELDKLYNNKMDAKHPVLIAAEFHIKFIGIHPFYDGNGRTVRILSNLILVACGYPPVIIKSQEKENIYYKSLADIQGYGGGHDIFNSFFATKVIESQEIVLSALQGKDIDEENDLDKKIKLFEKEFEIIDSEKEIKWNLNFDTVKQMYHDWIRNLIVEMVPVAQKFNKFYTDINHYISLNNIYNSNSFSDRSVSDLLEEIDQVFDKPANIKDFPNREMEWSISFQYGPFKKGGINTFSCYYSFRIKFEKTKYTYTQDTFSEDSAGSRHDKFTKLLHQGLTKAEIKKFAAEMGESLLAHMKYYMKDPKERL